MTKKSSIADGDPIKPVKPAKRKMRPGGGKSKGNGYESQIAKKLSVALAPLNFMRSPGSGARLGGKNFEKFGEMFGEDAMKLFVADVVPINERKEGLIFHHSIECKSYKTPDGFTALAAGTANIFAWFEESVVDAAKTGKNPLLIVKWNNTPSFVIADSQHEKYPTGQGGSSPCCVIISHNTKAESRPLRIYYLDELLTVPSFWFSKSVL
jgi:hypothetical protein